jgi:hypothetical protein
VLVYTALLAVVSLSTTLNKHVRQAA